MTDNAQSKQFAPQAAVIPLKCLMTLRHAGPTYSLQLMAEAAGPTNGKNKMFSWLSLRADGS
jgi:hypothetical protein